MIERLIEQIPVLVGGTLAIAGGTATQLFVHLLSEKRENRKIRRERIEALVKSVYGYAQWLDDYRVRMIFRNEDHDVPCPLDEARMIQSLHFPELSVELIAIQQVHIPLLSFIHEQKLKHMADKQRFLAEWDATPFNDAYAKLLVAINDLVAKCRTIIAN